MAHSYSPGSVTAFTTWFRSATAGLGADRGWFAVFLARDPQGMRAFLSGAQIPPWDVVASLLHDLEQMRGAGSGNRADVRKLHQEAFREHGLRTGRHALAQRLEFERSERDKAQEHLILLGDRAEANGSRTEALRVAHDVHQRAMARCAELQRRLAELDTLTLAPAHQKPVADPAPEPAKAQPTQDAARRRAEALGVLGSLAFGAQGAQLQYLILADDERESRGQVEQAEDVATTAIEWQEDRQIAWQLARLRASDSGGQAHVLVCDAVAGPPRRLPRLARAFEETGQAHEVSVLLWETALLPPAQLCMAVVAFSGEGRRDDVNLLLRHASVRQPADIGALVLALVAARHPSDASLVLQTVIRGRTRDFAVDVARVDSALVPLLLGAARDISSGHEAHLEYALRVEGLTGTRRRT